jgi:hypothetical protein
MERISIFNYEAFYLDFLEGNLGEEDTRMLMEFLDAHPECKLEDDNIATIELDEYEVFGAKSDLKQVDEASIIDHDNAEHFLIAQAEGILNREKSRELDQFVAAHSEYTETREHYKAVYFSPDNTEMFVHKDDLKQVRKIAIWPYVASLSAAAVIAFLIYMNGLTPNMEGSPVSHAAVIPTSLGQETKVIKQSNGLKQSFEDAQSSLMGPVIDGNPSTMEPSLSTLKTRPVQTALLSFADKKLAPVSSIEPKESMEQSNDQSVYANNEMVNPIEPITNFISDRTNTEVDFQRRTPTAKKKGGFFVKIGKFSISRNKH